jgi:hypothetical protein
MSVLVKTAQDSQFSDWAYLKGPHPDVPSMNNTCELRKIEKPSALALRVVPQLPID